MNIMQNISPGTGNEGTGRDVAGYNHITMQGIVNVEQKRSSPAGRSGAGENAKAGTGQPGYLSENGGAAS